MSRCSNNLCYNVCSRNASTTFSPLAERTDHKCGGQYKDFQCNGWRTCNIDTCMEPCDAKLATGVQNVPTYHATSMPTCTYDSNYGKVYCKINGKYIPTAKSLKPGTQCGTIYNGGDHTVHITTEGESGNGLECDKIVSTGQVNIHCGAGCSISRNGLILDQVLII